jgi:hypothetical protein
MVYRRIDFKGIFFCIVMATVIWFFHALNKTYTTRIKYPIELGIRQGNVVPVIPPPDFIELNVSGEGWFILRFNLGIGVEPIHLEVKNPTHIRHLSLQSFVPVLQKNLLKVKLLSFVKDSLDFHYDPLSSKEVYIRLHKPDIDLRENYRITSPVHIEPQVIRFRGASSLVDRLSDTLLINLSDKDIARDYNKSVKIIAPEHLHLETTDESVAVSFTVAPFTRSSKMLPLTLLHFPKDSSIFITEKQAIIQYEMPENLPDRLMPDTMHIIIDFYKINWQDSTITPVTTQLPEFIAEPVVSPSKFKVKYEKNRNNRGDRGW